MAGSKKMGNVLANQTQKTWLLGKSCLKPAK